MCESRYGNVSAKYQQMKENVEVTKIYSEDEMLHIQTANGGHLKYPWLWLRDNCQCPQCFNSQMQSRTINWRYFDTNIQPKDCSGKNESLNIEWSDGHKSEYAFDWLKKREFIKDVQEEWLQTYYKPKQVPWNSSNFHEILKRFNYTKIIESDEELLHWLKALATGGVAIIEGTPGDEDSLPNLVKRIGFIKRTHYGEKFIVTNKPDTTNLAYLAIPLQMHTDMPYYEYKPGVNLLQCVAQTTKGGENQLVDGVALAQWMKEIHPHCYDLLASTPVEWADQGSEGDSRFHTLHRAPVICEEPGSGRVVRINYNQWQRDSHFSVPLERVKPWYLALEVFTRALYDPAHMVTLKTCPGEVLAMDNVRVLHGRAGYTDGSVTRRLVGTYLDWDIVHSCLRVLQRDSSRQHE